MDGKLINSPFSLTTNNCEFRNCIFSGACTNEYFIRDSNQALTCLFDSCLFVNVSVSSSYIILFLEKASSAFINRCCFCESKGHLYLTGVETCWCLQSASLNSTVCIKCSLHCAPAIGGSVDFTFYHNNHTHLSATSSRSCYCHMRTPQNREDVSCFFSGTSCTGPHPVFLSSNADYCIMFKYNFVNNTNKNGYFHLQEGVKYVIKDSVISFISPSSSSKWIISAKSGAKLRLENVLVIAESTISDDQRVVAINLIRTEYAATHSLFRNGLNHGVCYPKTWDFSKSAYFSMRSDIAFWIVFALLRL